jgi:reactive intermediate/imine deaminase
LGAVDEPPVKRPVTAEEAPPPGGAYSQAIQVGGFVFVSGQTPRDRERNIIDGSFKDQVRQVIENLEAVARAAGSTLADAVSVRVYLKDWGQFDEMDAVYREMFPEPRPARTTIQSNLPVDVEIEAIFWKANSGREVT